MIAMLAQLGETLNAVGLPAGVVSYIVYRELLDRKRDRFVRENKPQVVAGNGKAGESRTTIERNTEERTLEKVWQQNTSDTLKQVIEDGDKSRKLQHETIGILKTIRDGIASLVDRAESGRG